MSREVDYGIQVSDMPKEVNYGSRVDYMPREFSNGTYVGEMRRKVSYGNYVSNMPRQVGYSNHVTDMPSEVSCGFHVGTMPREVFCRNHVMPRYIGNDNDVLGILREPIVGHPQYFDYITLYSSTIDHFVDKMSSSLNIYYVFHWFRKLLMSEIWINGIAVYKSVI